MYAKQQAVNCNIIMGKNNDSSLTYQQDTYKKKRKSSKLLMMHQSISRQVKSSVSSAFQAQVNPH